MPRSQMIIVRYWPGFRSVKCWPDAILKVMLDVETLVISWSGLRFYLCAVGPAVWQQGLGKLIVERN